MNRQIQGLVSPIWSRVSIFSVMVRSGLIISAGLGQFWFVDPGSFLDQLMDAYESDISISQWLTKHHWFS